MTELEKRKICFLFKMPKSKEIKKLILVDLSASNFITKPQLVDVMKYKLSVRGSLNNQIWYSTNINVVLLSIQLILVHSCPFLLSFRLANLDPI